MLGIGLLELFMVALIVFGFVKLISFAARGHDHAKYTEDETQVMQEICQGLRRMEERMDAMETILADHIDLKRDREPQDR